MVDVIQNIPELEFEEFSLNKTIKNKMQPMGEKIESFVIRIWVETDDELWRGQVTHVGSGEKIYFQDLKYMQEFIETYIGNMYTRPSRLKVLFRWLKRRVSDKGV